MKVRQFVDQRVSNLVAAFGILLAVIAPATLPMMASAAQLDSRAITMSSSKASDTSVSYQVAFDPQSTFQSVIVDFCSDSPIPGQNCGTPTGFDASGATVTFNTGTIGTVTTTGTAATHVVAAGSAPTANGNPVVFTIAGVTNPSTVGSFYARIYTYDTGTPVYTSVNNPGTTDDTGGIALSINAQIGVSAAVRETLTFCVAGDHGTLNAGTNYITSNCGDAATHAPNITLGHGTPAALDSSLTDTADVYTQISTNAASGAVVKMRNNNSCGGLKRLGASGCDIAPANTGNAITAGNAIFGMKVDTPSGGSGTVTGETNYTTGSNYGLTYDNTDATGVTSAYGDQIFHSSAPVNNVNVPLTFAASASNATPAGLYTATLNLVATGTF